MKHLAVLLALCGCTKHPAVFVAVSAGTIGALSCELQEGTDGDTLHTQAICGIITAGAALVLGGIAALVTHFADTSAHELPPDEEIAPGGMVRLHTHTAPPPIVVEPDAGVAPVDAAVISPPDA